MNDLGNHDMDLPLEPSSGDLHDVDDAMFAGGVVVMPSVVQLTDGVYPSIVFRFTNPVGEFYPPMVLVLDDGQMAKLRPLLVGAIQMARREAATRPRKS